MSTQRLMTDLTKNVTDGRETSCQNPSDEASATPNLRAVLELILTYVTPYSSRAPIMPNALTPAMLWHI